MEKSSKIVSSRRGDFPVLQASHIRKGLRYLREIGRLIALPAERLRRQVRRIRFNQNVLEWQSLRNVANVLCLRIRRVPGEGNQEAHVHPALSIVQRAA